MPLEEATILVPIRDSKGVAVDSPNKAVAILVVPKTTTKIYGSSLPH